MSSPDEIRDFLDRHGEGPVAEAMSETVILSQAGKISVSRRKSTKPKVLRPCPHCGEMFGFRDLRQHIPRCPKKETK